MPRMEWNQQDGVWEKQCSACKRVYEAVVSSWDTARNEFLKNFSPAAKYFDGMLSQCNSCRNNYNLRREDIDREELLTKQNNKCGLCFVEISFDNKTAKVDHCHTSGKTRKVLCQKCNVGMAAVDNNEWLVRAIAYRDSFRCE